MKKNRLSLAISLLRTLCLCPFLISTTRSQPSASNQLLKLQVAELNSFEIITEIPVQKASAQPGEQMEAATVTMRLVWTSNGENRKVTVVREYSSPSYNVRLHAFEVHHDIKARDVLLADEVPQDFLIGLSKSAGTCMVRFSVLGSPEEPQFPILSIRYTVTSS